MYFVIGVVILLNFLSFYDSIYIKCIIELI